MSHVFGQCRTCFWGRARTLTWIFLIPIVLIWAFRPSWREDFGITIAVIIFLIFHFATIKDFRRGAQRKCFAEDCDCCCHFRPADDCDCQCHAWCLRIEYRRKEDLPNPELSCDVCDDFHEGSEFKDINQAWYEVSGEDQCECGCHTARPGLYKEEYNCGCGCHRYHPENDASDDEKRSDNPPEPPAIQY